MATAIKAIPTQKGKEVNFFATPRKQNANIQKTTRISIPFASWLMRH